MTQSSSLGNGRNKPIIEKGKLERRIHFRRKKIKENSNLSMLSLTA